MSGVHRKEPSELAETGTRRIKDLIVELNAVVSLMNQYYVDLSGEKQKLDSARLHLGDAINSLAKSIELLEKVV